MSGDAIRKMLESEMENSGRFAKQNFGLAVGAEFREMVEEVLQSPKVTGTLLLGVLVTGLSGESISESMKKQMHGGPGAIETLRQTILDNLDAFKTPLEFLYWGIQIGRKQADEQAKALNALERMG